MKDIKKVFSFIWDVFKLFVVALVIVLPIRYFLFQPFLVRGQSMEPNFENGDYLIIDEITYQFRQPKRGEVIIFKYPEDPSQRFIKRIIGLPGEAIEIKDGKVKISQSGGYEVLDEKNYIPASFYTAGDLNIVLGDDEYFVMGDNRNFSFDSRKFGVLPKANIVGRVFIRAWPFAAFSKFEAPAYQPL